MKSWQAAILVFAVAAVTMSLTLQAYLHRDVPLFPLARTQTDYSFTVGDAPGFDLGTDHLRFGMVSPGGSARRAVLLEHAEASHVVVRVYGPGEGVLAPHEAIVPFSDGRAEVVFVLTVPESMQYGEYSGQVHFYMQ